jgi:hypothetical protein
MDQSWFEPGVVTASTGVAILNDPRFWSSSALETDLPEHRVVGHLPLRKSKLDADGCTVDLGAFFPDTAEYAAAAAAAFLKGDVASFAAAAFLAAMGGVAAAAAAFCDGNVPAAAAFCTGVGFLLLFFFAGFPAHDWDPPSWMEQKKSTSAKIILFWDMLISARSHAVLRSTR